MHTYIKTLTATCLALGLANCGGDDDVKSEEINTSDIYANIWVSGSENATDVYVQLIQGSANGEEIKLNSADTLSALAFSEEKNLSKANENELFTRYTYTTGFDDNVEGTPIQIKLTRAEEKNAFENHTTLPAPWLSLEPSQKQTVNIIDPITLTWQANYTGLADITLTLDCPITLTTENGSSSSRTSAERTYAIIDEGTTEVYFSQIFASDELKLIGAGAVCEGTVTLERSSTSGEIDPLLAGGSITALQTVTRAFTINMP